MAIRTPSRSYLKIPFRESLLYGHEIAFGGMNEQSGFGDFAEIVRFRNYISERDVLPMK